MFDECIEISDAEEIETPPSGEDPVFKTSKFSSCRFGDINMSSPEIDSVSSTTYQGKQVSENRPQDYSLRYFNDDEDDVGINDMDEEDDDLSITKVKGAYNMEDYSQLQVSPAVKKLFCYIIRYTPQTIEPEYKLQHFVPNLIPAAGDVDPFTSVPRPYLKMNDSDDIDLKLGLTVLDEPSLNQSDPVLLALKLRAITKQPKTDFSDATMAIKKVESAERNSKVIDNWIKDIQDLHREKALPSVHYKRPMPTMDALMQEWPIDFQEELKTYELPSTNLDCSLTQYMQIICTILDIPVYESRVESLHALFVLYSLIRDSQESNNYI